MQNSGKQHIENFAEIRESGFYYVDKTMLIEQLLQNWS
ncbi:AAA family ATPase [Roseburia sp. NSJ-9]|uniref:AAA family ATPase n=1 Tax=Roseburia lenta TaxID=2763061 RepID=A0ABR7GHA8_9FIRM|nr:AAA family ATPase [Roseburia lenta]